MKEKIFTDTWKLWYHHEKDDWKLMDIEIIFIKSNKGDFWELYNNWDAIGGLFQINIFF